MERRLFGEIKNPWAAIKLFQKETCTELLDKNTKVVTDIKERLKL